MSYQSGKDCSPEQTIQKIRSILVSVGLFPHEVFWGEHARNCYNVRLELDGFLETGVNGKGVSRPYALASAYGEMMERLQCNMLFKQFFGLMNELSQGYPDARTEKLHDLIRQSEQFYANMLNAEKSSLINMFHNRNVYCLPYFHVNSRSCTYLPESLINTTCGSNGMCAGNSASEALVQGLSEIVERYVSKQLKCPDYCFPDIPVAEVTNSILKEMIEDIQAKGYKLLIKDLTLGGVFPCLGVLIMNQSTMDYFLSLGSHPVFDIALQRCITEAFQVKEIQNKMNSFIELFSENGNFNFMRQLKLGNYKVDLSLLETNIPSIVYKNAFVEGQKSNHEMVKLVCDRLIARNFDIYIRDVSYLDFPAFRIYINGMSEMNWPKQVIDNANGSFSIRRYLMSLKKCNVQELRKLTSMVEEENKGFVELDYSSEYKFRDIFSQCAVIFKPGTDFHELLQDIDYFLAILYSRLADYEKAYLYLKKYIDKKHGELPGTKYFLCVLHFFKLRMQGKDDMQEIRGILESIHGAIAGEVIDDISDPEKAFRYFDLPSCGDCSRCSYSDGRCSYPSWKNYMQEFQKKINAYPVGQGKLISLFEKLTNV
jgi:uncharacterized domain